MMITALTTVYKTKDYMQKAYESFRKFYPDIHLLIGDNSEGDECSEYVYELTGDAHTSAMFFSKNVGHGEAMHRGIVDSNSDWVLVFDSDVEFKHDGLIEGMMMVAKSNTYGVGEVLRLSRAGHNVRDDYRGDTIKYLHPFCMLLNRNAYLSHPRFTVFGLPPLQAMIDLTDKKDDEKLIHFPCRNFVTHASGGTRARYGDVEDIVPGFSKKKGESQ